MSKNCLVTKLKGVIDNDSLYYLGCITITAQEVATPNYNKRNVAIYGDRIHTGCVAKVIKGNIYFTDSTGTANLGSEINLNTLNPFDEFYVSNGDGTILITNKYYIAGFNISQGTSVKLNVGSLSGCDIKNLNIRDGGYGKLAQSAYTYLNIQGGVFGDLSDSIFDDCTYFNVSQCPNLEGTLDMSNNTVITTFTCKHTDVTCNLDFIGNSSTLSEFDVQYSPKIGGSMANLANGITTNINIIGTSVNGTIEDYVEADWAKNRRTGDLIITSGLTFNDVVIRTLHIAYSNSVVVVRNTNASGNILGTYDGSTWTY